MKVISTPAPPRRVRRVAATAAIASGSFAAAGAASSLVAATYFARRVLTPERKRPDDVEILAFSDDAVTLGVTADTRVPGRYGLWLQAGTGHCRVGEILRIDEAEGIVSRELLGVDYGRLDIGTARWNPYYFGSAPDRSMGLSTEHVMVETDLGGMPAWLIPAPGRSDRWAVLVHGRGARREEALRAVSTLRSQGLTCLIPMYRNDDGAPAGADGRYSLGLSEWQDIEAAIEYAVDRGAREVVLGGWSMGGAIVLQTLARSASAEVVSRVFLDAPVINWHDVLDHHGRLNHIPGPVGQFGQLMMGRRWARRLVGVHDPVDVAQTDWVARADELRHPMLIIHSRDDEFVPVGPSERLAQARPDLVRFEPWAQARHCKAWNVDASRWERLVGEFVSPPASARSACRPPRPGSVGSR